MTQPNILIVSDETTFAKVLANRWRSESIVPAFTVFGSDRNWHFAADAFDMAVVGGIGGANLRSLLMELSKADKPILVLVEDPLVIGEQRFPHMKPGKPFLFQQQYLSARVGKGGGRCGPGRAPATDDDSPAGWGG